MSKKIEKKRREKIETYDTKKFYWNKWDMQKEKEILGR